GKPNRGAGTRNLLHGYAVFEIAEPCPAVFLLDRNAMQAECSHLGPKIAWENIVPIYIARTGRDAILRKIAHGFAQHVDVRPKAEIESRPCIWNHSVPPLAHLNRRNWRGHYKLALNLSAPRLKPAEPCRCA